MVKMGFSVWKCAKNPKILGFRSGFWVGNQSFLGHCVVGPKPSRKTHEKVGTIVRS